jgi:hypothetical protein
MREGLLDDVEDSGGITYGKFSKTAAARCEHARSERCREAITPASAVATHESTPPRVERGRDAFGADSTAANAAREFECPTKVVKQEQTEFSKQGFTRGGRFGRVLVKLVE